MFDAADAANPDQATPFQRRLLTLPRLFQDPAQAGAGNWPIGAVAEGQPAAITSGAAAPDRPGRRGWRPEDG